MISRIVPNFWKRSKKRSAESRARALKSKIIIRRAARRRYSGRFMKDIKAGCRKTIIWILMTWFVIPTNCFGQGPDILAGWQKPIPGTILIDEFQDINRLQYATIQMLAQPENNLFIVGDDDQSIYGFRGARPDIMLSFPKQYKSLERVTIGGNYRCTSQILRAATALIRHNKKRYDKKLLA